MSGFAAGLLQVMAFSCAGERQDKYSSFYGGAFGLLRSGLIRIVPPCFLSGPFLVYEAVRFDCVVLQLIGGKVKGDEGREGSSQPAATRRSSGDAHFQTSKERRRTCRVADHLPPPHYGNPSNCFVLFIKKKKNNKSSFCVFYSLF